MLCKKPLTHLNALILFHSSVAPTWGKCDDCKYFRCYYERCEKWDCVIDGRSVHNCWEFNGKIEAKQGD